MKSEASANHKPCRVIRLHKPRYPSISNPSEWDELASHVIPPLHSTPNNNYEGNSQYPSLGSKLPISSKDLKYLSTQDLCSSLSLPKYSLNPNSLNYTHQTHQEITHNNALLQRTAEPIFSKTRKLNQNLPDSGSILNFSKTSNAPNISTTYTGSSMENSDPFYRPYSAVAAKNALLGNGVGLTNISIGKANVSANTSIQHNASHSDIGIDLQSNRVQKNKHPDYAWRPSDSYEDRNILNKPNDFSHRPPIGGHMPYQWQQNQPTGQTTRTMTNALTGNIQPVKVCQKTETMALSRVLDPLTALAMKKEQLYKSIDVSSFVLTEKSSNSHDINPFNQNSKDLKSQKSLKEIPQQSILSEADLIKNLKTFKENNQNAIPKPTGIKLFEAPKIRAPILNIHKEKETDTIIKNSDLRENYSPNFEESPIKVNPIRSFKKTSLEEKSKENIVQKSLSKPPTQPQTSPEVFPEDPVVNTGGNNDKKRLFLKKTNLTWNKQNNALLDCFKADPSDQPRKTKSELKKSGVKARKGRDFVECLVDESIFKTIVDFLCMKSLCLITRVCKKFRTSDLLAIVKKAQCQLIMKGLSASEQYEFWDLHANFDYLQKTYPLQFTVNAMKPSKFEKDILSDVDRTRFFNSATVKQESLMKILLALSNSVPKIGYVQGLNVIAAVFLATNLKDSEVYWLIRYILTKKKFEEVLCDGFPRVQTLNYQLDIFARNYIPELVEYLGEKGLNISYFSTQWFITIFSYDLDLSHLMKVWNSFFVKGWKVLIRIALSLLWHFKSKIIKKSSDELPEFLKTCIREYLKEIPEEEIFKVAFSFKVSNRLLKGLEILYEHSAPSNVILTQDKNHRLEWKILSETYSPNLSSSSVQKDIIEYLNENLDQMKTINRLRGDAHHELDNYRSVQLESGACSLVVDRVQSATVKTRNDGSSELKTSKKPLGTRLKTQRSSDQTFLQTLSDFGKKIRQILTPKDNGLDFSQTEKLTESKILSAHEVRESSRREHPPFTDRNILSMSTVLVKKDSKEEFDSSEVENEEISGNKDSIPNGLKASSPKSFLDSIQPFADTEFNREDLNFDIGAITPAISTSDLFDKVEKEILHAPKKMNKHKKNSSLTQDLIRTLRKAHTEDLSYLDNEHNDSSRIEVNCTESIKTMRSGEEGRFDSSNMADINENTWGTFINKASRGTRESRYKEKIIEGPRTNHSNSQSEPVNHSNLSTDVFEYKESRKLPSKTGIDDFDLSEEF